MTIQVGRVTLRKGAKLHYCQDGRAVCPVAQGRHAIGEGAKPLAVDNAPLVCKRCRPALLAAAELAETDANMRAGISTTIRPNEVADACAALVDALRTPAERAAVELAREAFAARFYALPADTYQHAA